MAFLTGLKKQDSHTLIVRDLDKLVAEPVSFKLHGKVHTLNPVTVEEFWKFSEAMTKMNELTKRDGVTIEEVKLGYLTIFQALCPTITEQDVSNMTQPQVGALLQFVVDTIRGESQLEDYDAQKKNPQIRPQN